MSDTTPAPLRRTAPPSQTVKVARTLWLFSFAAGLLAVVFAFLSRNVQIANLRDIVQELKPGQDADTLQAVAVLVFWVSLLAIVVVVIIEALLLVGLMRRRPGLRWALLAVVLVLQVGAGVLASAFLVSPSAEGTTVFAILVASLLLAGAALVVGALPSASAWFRGKDEPRGGASA